MASSELRNRANWQTLSGYKALKAEDNFAKSLQSALDIVYPGVFLIDQHPKEFSDIYSIFDLPEDTKRRIYDVDVNEMNYNGTKKYKWGIKMDFAIRNQKNGKVLFGEIKRQDGWIETTKPEAGRGNAHERCSKYFSPGLRRELQLQSGLSEEILPFWIIFMGDITRDPKRNREIAFWFGDYNKNFFMWRDNNEVEDLFDFFENNLLPYLL